MSAIAHTVKDSGWSRLGVEVMLNVVPLFDAIFGLLNNILDVLASIVRGITITFG